MQTNERQWRILSRAMHRVGYRLTAEAFDDHQGRHRGSDISTAQLLVTFSLCSDNDVDFGGQLREGLGALVTGRIRTIAWGAVKAP